MRLAIVAASSYSRSGKLPELVHAESDVELLRQRLSEPDAAFSVHVLPAERGFADEVERLLATVEEPIDAFLLYFAGYAVVSEEGFPALVLDGERLSTISLRRLRRIVLAASPASFVVLDAISAFVAGGDSPDMVRLFNGVMAGRDSGMHLLAAHRTEEDGTQGPSPFSNLFALTLDWHVTGAGLTPEDLFASMQHEETLFSQIPSIDLFGAATPFQLLLPEATRAFSLPPAPEPSLDGAEARADVEIAAGNIEEALVELTLALEHVGPPPTPNHPPLYAKIASVLRKTERSDDALAYYDAALAIDAALIAALQGAAELRIAKGDRRGALPLLERWVAADPNALVALEQSARLLGESQSWDELLTLYESGLQRVSDARVAAELSLKIDALCQGILKRPERAIPSLERALALGPGDARILRRLAELLEHRGEPARALSHFVVALRTERRAGDYRTALRLFDRAGRQDGSWNAACALEVLGEADVNESLLAAAHRPEGLPPARESLTAEHWKQNLFCVERDTAIGELLALLGDGVIEVGLETAQRKRRSIALDPSTEQVPEKSTTTLIKMLAWSARLLGVGVPKVHLLAELRTPFLALPTRDPTIVVSRTLGSGLEMPALAFLWSRQLLLLRPEHRAIVFFPSAAELGALLLAALSVGGLEQLPLKKLEGDAKLFARSLRRHLPPDANEKLRAFVQTFPVRDATTRIFAWAKAVELAAGRAGLLSCGNVELAADLTRRFPLGGLAKPEQQIDDLLAYSVSDEYGVLRERLGIAIAGRPEKGPGESEDRSAVTSAEIPPRPELPNPEARL